MFLTDNLEGASATHYPEPYIVNPTSTHQQSWIVLHGRGDTAKTFASGYMGFLNLPFPDGRTIQQHLPNVKFIFPTAKPRPAQRFKEDQVTQWFDIYDWHSEEHLEWQLEGLRETSAWVHELINREATVVGVDNVVLGGLSQGCASALVSLLLWDGKPIKAVVGMSGWLPFRLVLDQAIQGGARNQADESEIKGKETDREPIQALCQALDVQTSARNTEWKVPIFLAHGNRDGTVDVRLGRDAADTIRGLGCRHLAEFFWE